jgi:hypothetical protein
MKYEVLIPIVGFARVKVEASTPKEAKEKALNTVTASDIEDMEFVEAVTGGSHPLPSIEVNADD